MSIVSLAKLDEQGISLREAIERVLTLLKFRFDRSIQRIVIKPNLCYYWDYSTGQTTDPKFVSTLVKVIRNRTNPHAEISVVESDASAMRCKYAFKMLGYEKMARNEKIKLVNLSNEENRKISVEIGNEPHQFSVPKTIASADLFINVPKIKYMPQTKISCALKNIFGCNPYPKKYKYHESLDEAIVSLNKIMRPDLTILDGIIVKGVQTRKLGLIMASTDPVALDAAASKIAGINPHTVKHIVLASKRKIGSMDFTPKGELLTYFQDLFPQKTMKYRIRSQILSLYYRFFSSGRE